MRSDGYIFTNLVTSKTRVAPVKQVSLPRLELCAAHLLVRLMVTLTNSMHLQDCEIFAWSDSTVVLAWLSDHPRRWKSFVANRTSYILEYIPSKYWRHIKSGNNPADLATRGVSSSDLLHNQLWWHGPDEIRNFNTDSHFIPPIPHGSDMEEKKELAIHMSAKTNEDIFDRYSNYIKLTHTTAFILRFIRNCRTTRQDRTYSFLTSLELQEAEYRLIRMAQQELYGTEIRTLMAGKQLTSVY